GPGRGDLPAAAALEVDGLVPDLEESARSGLPREVAGADGADPVQADARLEPRVEERRLPRGELHARDPGRGLGLGVGDPALPAPRSAAAGAEPLVAVRVRQPALEEDRGDLLRAGR